AEALSMSPAATRLCTDFAILAPVPVVHLESGRAHAERETLDQLAFGSGEVKDDTSLYAIELFRRIDEDRSGLPVMTLIYPSRYPDKPKPPYLVEWTGLYIGHVAARADGLHPDADPWKYRPPTCRENYGLDLAKERWSVYWHVQ